MLPLFSGLTLFLAFAVHWWSWRGPRPAWLCGCFSGWLKPGSQSLTHKPAPQKPKGRIETEPRGPSQLRGVRGHVRGVARTAPSQLRIATIRHSLKVFVLILPCFGHFGFKQKLTVHTGGLCHVRSMPLRQPNFGKRVPPRTPG